MKVILLVLGQSLYLHVAKTHREKSFTGGGLVAQSCPTLMIPWTVVHEIFQASTLEWVAISFPSGSSQYVSDEDHLPGSQTIILSSHGKDREREEEREKAGRKEEGKDKEKKSREH